MVWETVTCALPLWQLKATGASDSTFRIKSLPRRYVVRCLLGTFVFPILSVYGAFPSTGKPVEFHPWQVLLMTFLTVSVTPFYSRWTIITIIMFIDIFILNKVLEFWCTFFFYFPSYFVFVFLFLSVCLLKKWLLCCILLMIIQQNTETYPTT